VTCVEKALIHWPSLEHHSLEHHWLAMNQRMTAINASLESTPAHDSLEMNAHRMYLYAQCMCTYRSKALDYRSEFFSKPVAGERLGLSGTMYARPDYQVQCMRARTMRLFDCQVQCMPQQLCAFAKALSVVAKALSVVAKALSVVAKALSVVAKAFECGCKGV
jgi:hypothetical protein